MEGRRHLRGQLGLLPALAVTLWMSPATGSPTEGAICFDARNGFLIRPPSGWADDQAAGERTGLCAIYVVKGRTFANSDAVYYPRLVPLSGNFHSFVRQTLAKAQARARRLGAKKFKVTRLPRVTTKSGLDFSVYELTDGSPPNQHELLAFHSAREAALLVVLSATTRAGFRRRRRDFTAILERVKQLRHERLFALLKRLANRDARRGGARGRRRRASYKSDLLRLHGDNLHAALRGCIGPKTPLLPTVWQFDRRGKITGIVGRSDRPETRCLARRLVGLRGPPPPIAATRYHLFLELERGR